MVDRTKDENGNIALVNRLLSEEPIKYEEQINMDLTVPSNTTNLLHAVSLDVSQMKFAYMLSDKDVTFKTIPVSGSITTVTLKANIPRVWSAGSGELNPLGTYDFTGLSITTTTAAIIRLRFGIDPTP